jgi:polysaccharide export outer membrane protein
MTRTLAPALLAATLLAVSFVPTARPQTGGEPSNATPPAAQPLVIGSGDLVDVNVIDAPELSGHFRVDHRGDMQIPLLDALHLAGLTAEQAAKLIRDQYVQAKILVPEAARPTVFIEEYASQGITVSGEVKNPGIYPAFGVRMLNDVITAAGGATPLASSNVVVTQRNDPQHPTTVTYNPGALKPGMPDVQIFPGDTVLVPREGIVYVLGNVNRAGGFPLDGRDTLTIVKAMALAGGSARAAALNRTQVVRELKGGTKEMIILPLDKILKGQAPDIALGDGDILYVPQSNGKLATMQAITAAVAIGSGVAIYSAIH